MKIKFLILSVFISMSTLNLAFYEDEMVWEKTVKLSIEDESIDIVLSSDMTFWQLKDKVASQIGDDSFHLIVEDAPLDLDSNDKIDLYKITKHDEITVILK